MRPLTKKEYEESLNELPVAFDDQKSNGGRIPDNAKYGTWLRSNDPIAFNIGFNEARDLHEALGVKWGDDPYAAIDKLKFNSAAHSKGESRPCTCHPDDNPPMPCAEKYALSECKGESAPLVAKTPQGKQTQLIASSKVDKWLNELRQILVGRSEFKLADHVVSARVVIKMLENKRAETAAERDRLREELHIAIINSESQQKVIDRLAREYDAQTVERDQAREQVKTLLEELGNFVDCNMTEMREDFGDDADNQFRQWVQSRASAAIKSVESEGK